ncbi:MAG TPA: serine/threonine-protein kinase [Caulobacteraceae bacterium]
MRRHPTWVRDTLRNPMPVHLCPEPLEYLSKFPAELCSQAETGQISVQAAPVKPYHSKALPEGAILREWRLEGILGVGGFGIVYRGKGVYFGETVAIKEYFPSAICDRQPSGMVVPTDSASQEVYALGLEKFVDEAKVLWNLSKPERHPNIVSVRSLFEANGAAYLVMDFETGVPLSELLRAGRRFEQAELLGLLRPIADGLDRAHRAGVLHRDIKPANILIDEDGRPVLIDFGSARFDAGQATSTKVTFYTPPYAALEQYVKTYPQGPWTDIYALGVALYQCVTGEKPPEVLERLHAQSGEALSVRQRPGFSRSFTSAIDAAMAIRPAERPQSIPEWLALFEQPEDDDDDVTRIGVLTGAPVDEDVTRVGAPIGSPPASADTAAALVASILATGPRDDAEATEPGDAHLARRLMVPAVGLAVVAMAAAAGALLLQRSHVPGPVAQRPVPAPLTEPSAASAAPAAPIAPSKVVSPALENDVDGLIADAQRVGRPTKEIKALLGAKARIAVLASQVRNATAGDGARSGPLIAALTTEAATASRDEATALGHAAEGHRREVEQALGRSRAGQGAVAAVVQADARLDAAIAAMPASGDPVASIDAARRAVGDYAVFARAYGAAPRFYAPVKRSAFAAIDSRAQAIGSAVVALSAAAPRPWLFASQARKQAYRLLQDNSARSRASMAELDQLSRTITSDADLDVLNAAVTRASTIRRELSSLYAASNAARSAP